MKIFSIVGVRKSGKTTVVTELIRELKKRGFTVGTIKTIFCPTFSIDDPKSNTARHKEAGADVVCAKARNELDVLYARGYDDNEIFKKLDVDILLLEGDYEAAVPRIVCAHKEQEIDERSNSHTFAISGQIANRLQEYQGLPVINILTHPEELADLIEQKVPEAQFPISIEETPLAAPGFCHCGCHKAEKKQTAKTVTSEGGAESKSESLTLVSDTSLGRRHIFLTGAKQVGKSTIWKKVLAKMQEPVAGYQTLRYEINGVVKGYYLHSLQEMEEYENDSPICIRMGNQQNMAIPETYEQLGVHLLDKAMEEDQIVLMDEIGKLEKDASLFQYKVFQCLNRQRQVLGVLQRTNAEFVKAITARNDVTVLTVTEENREKIYQQVLEMLGLEDGHE